MDTETKMLIDFIALFPEYLVELKACPNIHELENWIFNNETKLIRFGKQDIWERTRFYAAVNFEQVYQWLQGEIYVPTGR